MRSDATGLDCTTAAAGIHVLSFLGAYMGARDAIRQHFPSTLMQPTGLHPRPRRTSSHVLRPRTAPCTTAPNQAAPGTGAALRLRKDGARMGPGRGQDVHYSPPVSTSPSVLRRTSIHAAAAATIRDHLGPRPIPAWRRDSTAGIGKKQARCICPALPSIPCGHSRWHRPYRRVWT